MTLADRIAQAESRVHWMTVAGESFPIHHRRYPPPMHDTPAARRIIGKRADALCGRLGMAPLITKTI